MVANLSDSANVNGTATVRSELAPFSINGVVTSSPVHTLLSYRLLFVSCVFCGRLPAIHARGDGPTKRCASHRSGARDAPPPRPWFDLIDGFGNNISCHSRLQRGTVPRLTELHYGESPPDRLT